MPLSFRPAALGLTSCLALGLGASSASAYPIDCAILLCMAGGFPASAECTAAKAEMIRRVTPVPVEPPLRLWRCPLQSAARIEGLGGIAALLAVRDTDVGGPADVPLTDPAFEFITSIRVHDVDWWHHDTDNENSMCWEYRSKARTGRYASDGQFTWSTRDDPTFLPGFAGAPSFAPSGACAHPGRWRGVVIEWRDHAGTPDHEVIRY